MEFEKFVVRYCWCKRQLKDSINGVATIDILSYLYQMLLIIEFSSTEHR